MDIKLVDKVKNRADARDFAIEWQIWQANESLSYVELAKWQETFRKLAKKYHLVREFKENGIL